MSRVLRWGAVGAALLCGASVSHAEITLDGSLGQAGALDGPHFEIPAEAGRLKGNNLFHSFGRFELAAGERATFDGPATVANVIARVTGGVASSLDGTLDTRSHLPAANFWLLNPAGVMLGQEAVLNVGGSLYLGAVDQVELGDGSRFNATPAPGEVLSAAPPVAFGFMEPTTARLEVNGTRLATDGGRGVTLAGGTVRLTNASIESGSGELRVEGTRIETSRGVLRAGEDGRIVLAARDALAIDDSFISGGTGSVIEASAPVVNLAGYGGFSADAAYGAGSGGEIRLEAGALTLTNGAYLSSRTRGEGAAGGSIRVTADSVLLDSSNLRLNPAIWAAGEDELGPYFYNAITNEYLIDDPAGPIEPATGERLATALRVDSQGGDAGTLAVTANTMSLRGGARLDAATAGQGRGGVIDLNINGLFSMQDSRAVLVAIGDNPGGKLKLAAETVAIRNSTLDAGVICCQGAGSGGEIDITAESLLLDRSRAEVLGSDLARGGRIAFNANQITFDLSVLETSNAGTLAVAAAHRLSVQDSFVTAGALGNIEASADQLRVSGYGGFKSEAFAGQQGGRITVEAGVLALENGGYINSRTRGEGSSGGVVEIVADRVELDSAGLTLNPVVWSAGEDELGPYFYNAITREYLLDTPDGPLAPDTFERLATLIRADATGGDAGSVHVTANELSVRNGARLDASTRGTGHGGVIELDVGFLDVSNAVVQVYAAGGGDGGAVAVTADRMRLSEGALVAADTVSTGRGGRIEWSLGELYMRDSRIDLETRDTGTGGDLSITANRLALVDSVITASTNGPGNSGSLSLRADEFSLLHSAVGAGTSSLGAGGDISLEAGALVLADSTLSASSTLPYEGVAGVAGGIRLVANRVELRNSSISTSSVAADGGDISVVARSLVYLLDSELSTSVGTGNGGGGNIAIDPEFIVLNRGRIVAQAYGGPGGNITLIANNLLQTPDSLISASSALGVSGTVVVSAPESNVAGGLAVLPSAYQDATSLLKAACGSRAGEARGSLVAQAGGPLVPSVDAPLVDAVAAQAATPLDGIALTGTEPEGCL